MKLDWAVEPLLPREIAPLLERSQYVIQGERYTCVKVALFGRRLIVDLIRAA